MLVALVLFHSLSWNEQAKRAEAVVRRALPAPVADFLLAGGGDELPADLARHRGDSGDPDLVALDRAVAGSNSWVTTGEEPLLACDLHLSLGLPNLLYEVDLAWPGTRLRGLAGTGLPVVLTGTNGRIAWGVTNLTADVLDLVPAGQDGLRTRTETIRVRGQRPTAVDITTDGTMPVPETPLCGEKIAVRWAGHDPRAADLRFHRLAHAADVGEAVAVLDDAHGVALNVLVVDRERMAHLATGLLPRRPAGTPRTDPADGHLTGPQRPRVVDPADGILVSANDAALPEDEFRIGLDLDPGHRARRIRAVLTATGHPDAAAMTALQHDISAELHLAYRDLAVAALPPADPTRTLLEGWDGTASTDSRAFGVLVRLRGLLAQRVLAPYLAVCREHDPAFRFTLRDLDRPLLAILRARDTALLPAGTTDVDAFVADCVTAVLRDRQEKWGKLNRVGLRHPLVALAPWADALLGIRPRPQAGMLHSVRTAVAGFGAAGRVVLTPDDLVTTELSLIHIPLGEPAPVPGTDPPRGLRPRAPPTGRGLGSALTRFRGLLGPLAEVPADLGQQRLRRGEELEVPALQLDGPAVGRGVLPAAHELRGDLDVVGPADRRDPRGDRDVTGGVALVRLDVVDEHLQPHLDERPGRLAAEVGDDVAELGAQPVAVQLQQPAVRAVVRGHLPRDENPGGQRESGRGELPGHLHAGERPAAVPEERERLVEMRPEVFDEPFGHGLVGPVVRLGDPVLPGRWLDQADVDRTDAPRPRLVHRGAAPRVGEQEEARTGVRVGTAQEPSRRLLPAGRRSAHADDRRGRWSGTSRPWFPLSHSENGRVHA